MDLSNIQTWFPHPQISNAKVHVIFDVCHMIKLMQNLLGDQKVICYEENDTIQRIKWQYMVALLIEGHHKTVIWGFTFSIHSLVINCVRVSVP